MLHQLLDRRVPQFVGLYVVGGWGVLQFVDFLVDRYLLSPALIDLSFAVLLLFVPTVFVIAWRHGAPGADEWKRIDGAAIGLNLLVASAALFVLFRGRELGAATTVKLLEDAEGNTVQRSVPKAGFRRSALLFGFDNETGDPDLDWLKTGLLLAVSLDISQDPFVQVTTSLDDDGVRELLAEGGVEPEGTVPLSLKRNAALARGTLHFVGGTIGFGRGDTLRVATRLYDTQTGRVTASHEYLAVTPLDVADRISVDLRRDMGIPDGQIEQSVDLPARELITDSQSAFRAISEAAGSLRTDLATAAEKARQAVALDSTSAVAHLMVVNAAFLAGDQAAARDAMSAAARYDYRLPERTRLGLQVQSAWLFDGDVEAAIRAGKYWTEVYPQDVEARRLLSAIFGVSGNGEGQIQQLHALLAIDSTDVDAMRTLGRAFAGQAEYDSAVSYYEDLLERRPGDLDTRLELASTLRAANRNDAARDALREAGVVAPRDPDVPRQLALLDIQAGDFEGAERQLEEVRSRERTPAERERRAGLEETFYYERGQFSRLEGAYRRRLAMLAASQPQIQVVASIFNSEFLIFAAEAGREREALAQIDSLRSTVQEPWNLFLAMSALRIHLDVGDVEAARSSLAAARRLIDTFGAADVREANFAWAAGRIAALEDGDCRRAIREYDRARELNPNGAQYHLTRLECLTELKRWDDAQAEAEWLLERSPAHGKYLLAAARLDAARGRRDEAIGHLETALATWSAADPGYRPAREARALLDTLRGA